MFEILIDALMFVLASAAFAGVILALETFIASLIDPRRIDCIPPASRRSNADPALGRN